jgi:hypothetical protein
MSRPGVGDLCAMAHTRNPAVIIISEDELLQDVLAEVGCDVMMMVTNARSGVRHKRALHIMRDAAREKHDLEGAEVLQVVVANGPHAGSVGYVASFWLRVVLPAPR